MTIFTSRLLARFPCFFYVAPLRSFSRFSLDSNKMAATANHLPPPLSPKQTASSRTPKHNTSSSHIHCFQSSKFISPRSSIELNRKYVSVSSPGQGRSLRAFVDSSRVMDQFTPNVEHRVPRIVEVDLGNRSYPIYIGSGLLDKPELLQRHVHGKRVLVVTNNTIAPLYLDKVADALTRGNKNVSVDDIILPDGEQYKDMDTLLRVMDKAPSHELGQRDTFVALGGGVIGDICGFAASLFMRGVNFIQIPTTVIAQVDSSVGGKARINHSYSIVDAVCQPQSVLIDTDTLNTLPDRELASGFAEVMKYGLIRDAQFFGWLEKNMQPFMARDPSALAFAIKRSCEIKAEVVSLDEKESGPRPTLNLGHTFGNVSAFISLVMVFVSDFLAVKLVMWISYSG